MRSSPNCTGWCKGQFCIAYSGAVVITAACPKGTVRRASRAALPIQNLLELYTEKHLKTIRFFTFLFVSVWILIAVLTVIIRIRQGTTSKGFGFLLQKGRLLGVHGDGFSRFFAGLEICRAGAVDRCVGSVRLGAGLFPGSACGNPLAIAPLWSCRWTDCTRIGSNP